MNGMSKKVKFELNLAGLNELRRSSGMQAVLSSMASARATRAGNGFDYEVKTGKKRAYANIRATTNEARKKNQENNVLAKVISS